MTQPEGYCAEGFEGVRDAFVQNFASGDEVGASACVVHDEKVVVDLWAGAANPQGDPWQQDTIVNVYSTNLTLIKTDDSVPLNVKHSEKLVAHLR